MRTPRMLAGGIMLGLLLGLVLTPAAGADIADVAVLDNAFNPDELTVAVGDEVRWTWSDGGGNTHTVTADDGTFASEFMSEGEFSQVFDEAGTVPYFCEVHGGPGGVGMSGVITVGTTEPSPSPSPSPSPTPPPPAPPPPPPPGPPPGQLPAAEDNVEAALAWSGLLPDDGADVVLLGRDDLFADSLASGPGQGVQSAPLLLTGSQALDDRVRAELERLGTEEVYLFGGTNALAPAVEQTLRDDGYEVQRVQGATRIETAIDAARTFLPDATMAVMARAGAATADPTQAFADSLGAGALSAHLRLPVLLSETERLSDSTREYLAQSAFERVLLAGGTAALSEQVATDLADMGIAVERYAGPDRFATAVALAERSFRDGNPPATAIVSEGQAADAWAAGFTAALTARTLPFLLVNGDAVPEATRAALTEFDGVLCGPTVSAEACDAATEVASG